MEQGRRGWNIEKDAFHANFDDAEALEKFSGNCARIWNLELSKFQKLLSHFADAATLQNEIFFAESARKLFKLLMCALCF